MWEEYEDALETVTAISKGAIQTTPALISACKLCHWHSHCRRQINQSDDLTLISELGRSKRGKLFFGCDQYPDCTFVMWKRPVNKACPLCDRSYLVERVTKRQGRELLCDSESCDHREAG